MKYFVTYEISDDAKGLYAVVEPEKKDLLTERAQVDIEFRNNVCKFIIKAKDFTAFRAMNNSVMRLITIYNKMKAV